MSKSKPDLSTLLFYEGEETDLINIAKAVETVMDKTFLPLAFAEDGNFAEKWQPETAEMMVKINAIVDWEIESCLNKYFNLNSRMKEVALEINAIEAAAAE